jgi:hypothetical protein
MPSCRTQSIAIMHPCRPCPTPPSPPMFCQTATAHTFLLLTLLPACRFTRSVVHIDSHGDSLEGWLYLPKDRWGAAVNYSHPFYACFVSHLFVRYCSPNCRHHGTQHVIHDTSQTLDLETHAPTHQSPLTLAPTINTIPPTVAFPPYLRPQPHPHPQPRSPAPPQIVIMVHGMGALSAPYTTMSACFHPPPLPHTPHPPPPIPAAQHLPRW